ncbi:unnamed protein product, partial [Soboliphyme baturini]|uniref:HTH La-type RNA-binding domain-containing protein n=1 Tax=Soboliphyme baturini TaxID=241478 RepID=A0A183J972_9BILA
GPSKSRDTQVSKNSQNSKKGSKYKWKNFDIDVEYASRVPTRPYRRSRGSTREGGSSGSAEFHPRNVYVNNSRYQTAMRYGAATDVQEVLPGESGFSSASTIAAAAPLPETDGAGSWNLGADGNDGANTSEMDDKRRLDKNKLISPGSNGGHYSGPPLTNREYKYRPRQQHRRNVETENAEVDDNFDYMELLDIQYAQYYAMTSVPPFELNPSNGAVDCSLVPSALSPHSNGEMVPGPAFVIVPTADELAVTAVSNGMTDSGTNSAIASPIVHVGGSQVASLGAPAVVPYISVSAFSPIIPTFMSVDEDILKEYIRKQMYAFLTCSYFLVSSFADFSEYYFSDENLQRDFFLRRKMDAQGFLPLSLIATTSFSVLSLLSVAFLSSAANAVRFQALQESVTVELSRDGVKVRARNEPTKWVIEKDMRSYIPEQRSFDSATNAVVVDVPSSVSQPVKKMNL